MRIALKTAAPESALELRKIKRYYVQAPAVFFWKDSDGRAQTGEGTTRDISTAAVFVKSRDCPSAGDQLRLKVLLPSLSGRPGVRLHGEGIVLRVDRAESGAVGFALITCLRSGARDAMDILLNTVTESGRVQ